MAPISGITIEPSPRPFDRRLLVAVSVVALLAGLSLVPRTAHAQVEQAAEVPTLELNPNCWNDTGLQTVQISGHSYTPNTNVTVYLPDFGQTANTATTDDYGRLVTALNIAVSGPGGVHISASYNGESSIADAYFGACNTTPGLAARIDPQCVDPAAKAIHLVGSGWGATPPQPPSPAPTNDPDNAEINFELYAPGSYFAVATTTLPAATTFDFTWSPVIPAAGATPPTPDPNSVPWPTGAYQVHIFQNGYVGGEQTIENDLSLQVQVGNCPQATVSPLCGAVGGPPTRQAISIEGTGFDSSTDLHVLFDPQGIPQEFVYKYPPQSTSGGSFGPIQIQPFARSAGAYTIELVQHDSTGSLITHDLTATFTIPCAQPTLAPASPDCGDAVAPGISQTYSITVTGSNFVPSEDITIVFDPDDAAGSDYPPTAFSGATDANGGVYAAISPGYRPSGYYRILAYQDTAGGHFEADTTFNVPCIGPPISPPPTLPPGSAVISVNPTCAPAAAGELAAYSLSLTGGGFTPGTVTVVLDAAGTPFTGTVEADVSGYISATFVADGKANGTYQLVASQDNNGTLIQASSTLTVPCQTLTINPTCAAPADGLAGAYAIVASGIGFVAGPVDLVFDPTGLAPAATQVQADTTGAFTAPLTLTGKPAGVYDLVASQETSYGLIVQASAQLLVPCGAVVVRITPATGPRGFVPTVEGFGFPPNATLTLEWDVGIGSAQTVNVLTDALGSFSRQIVIYQHDFLGPRHVIVADPANALAYAGVTATYLVAAAPIQPPFSADDTAVPSPEPVIFQR